MAISTQTRREPVFTAISQNAITVAGYATLSIQSLRTAGGLQRAVDSHLSKSVRDKADAVLIDGTTVTAWPFSGFEALASVYHPGGTVDSLADAIVAGKLRMQLQGFSPSIVVMAEADLLTIVTQRGSDGHYIAGPQVSASLITALSGLRVAMSGSMNAGQAMLVDTAFVGALTSDSVNVTIGFIDDDFTKNLIRVRGEMDLIPYLSDFQAALVVAPNS